MFKLKIGLIADWVFGENLFSVLDSTIYNIIWDLAKTGIEFDSLFLLIVVFPLELSIIVLELVLFIKAIREARHNFVKKFAFARVITGSLFFLFIIIQFIFSMISGPKNYVFTWVFLQS